MLTLGTFPNPTPPRLGIRRRHSQHAVPFFPGRNCRMRRHNVTILAASLVFSIGDVGSYLLPIWPPQLPTHPATLTSLLPADWWFSSICADMYLAIPQPCCQRCVMRHI